LQIKKIIAQYPASCAVAVPVVPVAKYCNAFADLIGFPHHLYIQTRNRQEIAKKISVDF